MTTETDDRITKLLTDARAALDDLGIRETAGESDADGDAGEAGGDEGRPLELTTDLEGGAQDGLPEPISSTDLPSLAEEAHELVEEGDVQSLLERVGLDTLPDGSTPSSLPEAIANGDPGQVATLRALQRLASLADPDSDSDSDLDDADSLEETVLDLYGLLTKSVAVETGDEESSEAETDASDDAEEPGEEEGEAPVDETDEDESDEDRMDEEKGEDEMDEESEADQKDEDETDESEESTSESDSEPSEATDETDEVDETGDDGDLEDSISSALKNAVGGFGDEVKSLKAGLEAAGLGDDEEVDAEDEADPEDEEANGDDTDKEDGDEGDEADDAEEDKEDDGLLSTGDDGGPFGGSSSGRRRGTMYSTVARSPSKRADMKATTRHSTMPKRN